MLVKAFDRAMRDASASVARQGIFEPLSSGNLTPRAGHGWGVRHERGVSPMVHAHRGLHRVDW